MRELIRLEPVAVTLALLVGVLFPQQVIACPAGDPAVVVSATGVSVSGNQNLVDVVFSEEIMGSSTPAHWTIDANVVTVITPLSDDTVRLQTLRPLDDDPDGSLVYRSLGGSGYEDTCDNAVPDATVSITDGIEPKTPIIAGTSVSDPARGFLGHQGGEFYTNTNTPLFRVVNPSGQMNRAVRAGYTIEVWEETNGSAGLQRAGVSSDTLRGSALVNGKDPSEGGDCESDPAATGLPGQVPACEVSIATDLSDTHAASGNQTLQVYAVARDTRPPGDGGPNISPPATAALNLDFVAPVLSGATPEAGQIRVLFSEPVPRGRNFSADWSSRDELNRALVVSSVTVTSDSSERVLPVGSTFYEASKVAYVKYGYVGPQNGTPEEVQYEDRATNAISTPTVICLPAGSAAGLC